MMPVILTGMATLGAILFPRVVRDQARDKAAAELVIQTEAFLEVVSRD